MITNIKMEYAKKVELACREFRETEDERKFKERLGGLKGYYGKFILK